MTKKEIINKLKNNNKNIKYAEFCSILKPYQIRQFLNIIKKYNLEE